MAIPIPFKHFCNIKILISILMTSLAGCPLVGQDFSEAYVAEKSYEDPLPIDLISETISLRIDSIITDGILKKAFPGAQVLTAHKGKIIYHKAFGYATYDSIQKLPLNALYDLASVTKIIGPLPALMKLYDEGKIELDVPFSNYWPAWKKRKDKRDLTLREILSHQAGLEPYIVFMNEVLKKSKIKSSIIHNTASSRFNKPINDSLYIRSSFKKKIYREITQSSVGEEKKYKYSGLAFLIFPKVIENLSGSSYEYYLYKNFYQPLGSITLGYTPKERNLLNETIPTEYDSIFRKTLVKSWVHDENAALFGGVSGNAGLFGTAMDLFKIMQMYQNYGIYNYRKYISELTLKEFTKTQYPLNDNRRGLGFDKPYLNNDSLPITEAYPAPSASKESFGHSGFTGTFVWADPENQLVYIFLSNRVYPTRSHRNLYNLNIRTSIHQLFYNEILGY